jgi:hypothetical protein
MNSLPVNWDETLRQCNFFSARREIAEFIQIGNREAKNRGGYYAYKREFVEGWESFAKNPCYETAKQFIERAPEYADVIFHYFSECCPGGLFYRTGIRSAENFPLGDYRLNMELQEIKGLKELTMEEYDVFKRESLQDSIYHADPTEFVGRSWNIMVGAIEGSLYEIGANLETSSQEKTEEIVRSVFKYCEQFLGTPSKEKPGLFIWDTNTGSIVFQFAIIEDTFAANLFVANRPRSRYGNS